VFGVQRERASEKAALLFLVGAAGTIAVGQSKECLLASYMAH